MGRRSQPRGFTLIEVLIAIVVVIVLTAMAIPLYHSHLLRVRRTDASLALIALQGAQDRYFGRSARYADGAQLTQPAPAGLGLQATSELGYYHIELRAAGDGLGYVATAQAAHSGQDADTRCVQLTIDHNGQRRAVDAGGADRSQDCWR